MSNYTMEPPERRDPYRDSSCWLQGDEALDIANARKDKNRITYYFDIDPREMDAKDGTSLRLTIRISMNVESQQRALLPTRANTTAARIETHIGYMIPLGGSAIPAAALEALVVLSAYGVLEQILLILVGDHISSQDPSILTISTMHAKGAPPPGTLEIKVRAYAKQSNSALTSFSFRLIGEPTLACKNRIQHLPR